MSAERQADIQRFDTYFFENPDSLDIKIGPDEGLYTHAFRWNIDIRNDDIKLLEQFMDARALHDTFADPKLERLFGMFSLFAVDVTAISPTSDTDLYVRYPTVELLEERRQQVVDKVPYFKPPHFKAYDGGIYSAEAFATALQDGYVLLSGDTMLEHDVVEHVPGWLTLPPYIFEAFQRQAENALKHPGTPDSMGRVAANVLMDKLDLTIGIAPIIGKVLINEAALPSYDTSHSLTMREAVGGPETAGHQAFKDIRTYFLSVSEEIAA